jgi:CheY-like chemotaxis protein
MHQRGEIASRQIGASDRSRKERVADEQLLPFGPTRADLQANAARAVPRRVMGRHHVRAERDSLPRDVEEIDRRRRLDPETEHHSLGHRLLVQKQVVMVEMDRDGERPLGRSNAGHMVHVRMRQEYVADGEPPPIGELEELPDLVAGIDQYRVVRLFAAQYEAVLEKRSDRLRLHYHDAVILAVVDDLIFTSKIKTAAGQLGVPVIFARSRDAALEQMRRDAPSLVIFDLNGDRMDPLGTVAAMKGEAALSAIPTIGFVSHVQAELIDAARRVGVGEVMARSAFTMRLAEILKAG